MRYMGGKSRLGKRLAEVMQSYVKDSYHEPFCGMFSVGKHIKAASRSGWDCHPDLILMLNAVQDGWEPPNKVDERLYKRLKSEEPSALRGAVGFACSYYGKFFGGFARAEGQDFGGMLYRGCSKLRPLIQGVDFQCRDFTEYQGGADVIYCDPPYRGTTGFTEGDFDHESFWDWVREHSKVSHVFVSEYSAPDDFEEVWCSPYRTTMRNKNNSGIDRVEKLFKWT